MTRRSHSQGFTLIEAAVAIAVVAILSGIVIPLVVKNLRDSQIARAKNDVQVFAATIASQIKDTGRTPRAAGGFNGATGAGNALWGSGPTGTANIAGLAVAANNTFTNLFTADARVPAELLAANTMFGFAAATAQQELQYRGPYLGNDVAAKLDPWGNRYVIIGYNANSGNINGPVWVICAGPNGTINAANATYNAATGYPSTWNYGAANSASADDIVIRVN